MINELNGILVVDKPAGFTSFDVVAKLRGICGTKKIGHGGTLDPMATGVLPVFVGGAVKAVDLAPRQDKTYEAEVLFGLATDTGDITGAVLRQAAAAVTAEALCAVLPRFAGETQQLPPMYSAVKVDGKPLYKYAREGKTVRRKLRTVTLHTLEMTGQTGENRFGLRVHCSKGTYIRTLVEDIGAALEVPATLAALRRTGAGVFGAAQAKGFDEIQAARDVGRLHTLFVPVEALFEEYPRVQLKTEDAKRLANGVAVAGVDAPAGLCRVYADGAFLGLCEQLHGGQMKVKKLFFREG